ncbi:succinate dehydrogenase/fumarate reductase flavoprotein subunit [Xanthomonas sacchari]|uniref:hypothetical protein n=1 Tax=unclassified Xanthomonas TaxID=2643310 RepID=UPI00180B4BFD|nr:MULTISPECIES: hypothetical protein [unclassified Xanthomonas]MBB6365855.1 succinate dehydrogenase/fumarate reductase flavoprotein subunit [Xanthomonas sp. F10]
MVVPGNSRITTFVGAAEPGGVALSGCVFDGKLAGVDAAAITRGLTNNAPRPNSPNWLTYRRIGLWSMGSPELGMLFSS